jgi:hypothetical protein
LGEIINRRRTENYFHGGGGNSSALPQLSSQRLTSAQGTPRPESSSASAFRSVCSSASASS